MSGGFAEHRAGRGGSAAGRRQPQVAVRSSSSCEHAEPSTQQRSRPERDLGGEFRSGPVNKHGLPEQSAEGVRHALLRKLSAA